jgi:hypothetical protein
LFSPEAIVGVDEAVNAAQTFVLFPLEKVAATVPGLAQALARYDAAPRAMQLSWANAYATVVTKVRFQRGSALVP